MRTATSQDAGAASMCFSSKAAKHIVHRGIPAIKRGEVSFWSVSCLPAHNNPDLTVFMRVNIWD